MKLHIFLYVLVLNGLCAVITAAYRPTQSSSRRLDRFWTSNRKGIRTSNHVRSPIRRDSDSDSDKEESGDDSEDDSGKKMQVPQINFYSSVPNGFGVIGQGIIWLREISAALGTPLPLWIFSIPITLLGIGLMFLPDLTSLGLPGFYPDGAGKDDPLAAFPPLLDIEGLKDLDIIQKATQLLPATLLQVAKRG